MKKNLLTAAVAMLSMLMTSTCFTACGDDDDDDDKDSSSVTENITWKETSVDVEAGSTVYFKHGSKEGSFVVTSAETGKVVLAVSYDGNTNSVTLSDAGTSYCSTSCEGLTQSAAESDPSSVLFALASSSTTVESGTEVKSATIKAGASATYFYTYSK